MILENLPEFQNEHILQAFITAENIINNRGYKNIVCSLSGGSDSDIMLDIIYRVDYQRKVEYIYIDTGLEYAATKEHIKWLNGYKYRDILIKTIRPDVPIPLAVKTYGIPFVSKMVSQFINTLQRHNFKFEEGEFSELLKKYPECSSALSWWCNVNKGRFNISYNRYLKEFLIENPPKFRISNKCCDYAKKNPAHDLEYMMDADLTILGIRKSEGGIRSITYKSCFDDNSKVAHYRPLFWFTNSDKKYYEQIFNIKHSRCYTQYGLERTGCVCCPYGKDVNWHLENLKEYEPDLYLACKNVFGPSYSYTAKWQEFRLKKKDEYHINKKREKLKKYFEEI